MTKPILIFGYGNLSRGDDALGPLLLDAIKDKVDTNSVELLTDFQLQIEHALDLENRELVLFIDASVSLKKSFDFYELQASIDKSYTTHAMSPAAVLHVYQSIKNQTAPPCFLLSIQGLRFELGESLSSQAAHNLKQATQFTETLLKKPSIDFWRKQQSSHKEAEIA